jgi:hypothetical protein
MDSTYLTIHTKEPREVTLSGTNIIELLFLMVHISSMLYFLSSVDLVIRFLTTFCLLLILEDKHFRTFLTKPSSEFLLKYSLKILY